MSQTLLQKAKTFKSKGNYARNVDDQMVEVAVAWLRGEVSTGQVAKALGLNAHSSTTSTLFQMCTALREGGKKGLIEVTYKK